MVNTITRGRTDALEARCLLLFVPANQPQRFVKAATAGADGVIIDLEDSIAADEKDSARASLERSVCRIVAETRVFVRINAVNTPWHAMDIAAISRLPIAGIVLPKAERAEDLVHLAQVTGTRTSIIALIETARGLAAARTLATVAGRMAFGSLDFVSDIGAEHTRDALLYARTELVLAARLAGLQGPIDGVTASLDAAEEVEADAAYAAALGFAGKLLLHPKQVAPAAHGFLPAAKEIAWAERVLAAPDSAMSVVDGKMVDAPVRLRAEQVLRRADLRKRKG